MRPAHLMAAVLAAGLVASSCAGAPPEVPLGSDGLPDPVLSVGREVYGNRCSSCHGNSGGGGRGPKLSDGAVVEAYPEVLDQIERVTDGKGQMPSFLGQLSQAQIEAVVRYTREVLS